MSRRRLGRSLARSLSPSSLSIIFSGTSLWGSSARRRLQRFQEAVSSSLLPFADNSLMSCVVEVFEGSLFGSFGRAVDDDEHRPLAPCICAAGSPREPAACRRLAAKAKT